MRPECVSRVTAAAAAKGRQLSIADLNGIEARVRNNLRQLRRAKGEADFMGMTREQRMQEAAKMAADQLIADKVLKKQRAARDIQVVHSLNSLVDEIRARIPGISRLDALDRVLFQKQDGRSGVFSLEDRINGTQKAYLRQLESLFDLADRGHLASVFADPEATAAFTRELRGQDSGNPAAKQAADAVRQVMDAQVKQYRALGGKLDPLADYAHPQETSTHLARQMGQDKWVDFTVTKLDRSRYVNEDGTLMSDVQVRRFLGEAWKSLAHNGAAKAPGANVGKGLGALGNQRAAHRQLHFKDADSWMEYSKQLSESDMFSMVLNRVNSMSRDIAVLEVLGHNPANMTAKLFGEARAADAGADTGAGGKTDWDAKEGYLDRKFRYMAGGSDVFSQHGFARFLRGYRNVKVGSSMGSLLFAQLGDQGTMAAIARQNNASLKMLYDGQRMFFTPEGRQRMKALGLGIDLMADELARIGDINSNVGITGKLATLTHRLSLATAMTNMERQAFRYMMWGSMADMVKKTDTLAGLHERDARVLRSKGLTDADWAVWRMADPEAVGEAALLTPAAIDAIPTERIKQAIPDQIAAIEKETAEVVARLEAQNAKENEWVAKRQEKFEGYKERIDERLAQFKEYRKAIQDDIVAKGMGAIADLRARREGFTAEMKAKSETQLREMQESLAQRQEAAVAAAEARVELLRAEAERAEVEADIATYLRAAKDIEAQRQFLERVDEGASLERNAAASKRRTEELVKFQGRTGEALGARRARAERAIRDTKAKLDQLEKQSDERLAAREAELDARIAKAESAKESDSAKLESQFARRLAEAERKAQKQIAAKEKEFTNRIYSRMFELAEFSNRAQERVAKRQEIAAEWQKSVGSKIERAAEKAKQEAIIKLYGTTDMETNTAILQPNVSERFALRSLGGNIDPNSVVGEIAATFLQFKGFPFAYLNRHIDRMAFEGGVNRWKYGLSIVAATTVMGGFAVLLSEMAKGQDPRDIEANPGRFALESFLKGGGLGIYGDILLKPQEQGFQSSLADVTLGPVVGDLSKAWNITTGLKNLPVADDPEKVKDRIAANTVRLVKGNTPFANLWYTRAMTDRWLFNQASEWANPGYLERMKKRAAKQGTTFYYEPDAEFGEFPERGPDLGKAVGNPSAP